MIQSMKVMMQTKKQSPPSKKKLTDILNVILPLRGKKKEKKILEIVNYAHLDCFKTPSFQKVKIFKSVRSNAENKREPD